MPCSSASRSKGGVILLHGVGIDTLALPKVPGLTRLPHTRDALPQAAGLVAQGAQVAVHVPPADEPRYADGLRRAGVPCASVFVYCSPAQLAAQATGLPQAVELLREFGAKVTGTLERGAVRLGTLRRSDVQRAVAGVRRMAGPGAAGAALCEALEQELCAALGLDGHRAVFVTPRRPAHVALPVASFAKVTRAVAPYFASLGAPALAGSVAAATASPAAATPSPGPAGTAGPAAGAACARYYVVQNGVNAATVSDAALQAAGGDSLAAMRAALNSEAPAKGMKFLNPQQFPVNTADEAELSCEAVATDCTLTMSSQKQSADPAAVAAAASAAQASAGAAQESAQAARGRLAPAATVGALPDATMTVAVAGSAGDVVHAADMTMDQWRRVFESNGLLRGYNMTAQGPVAAPRAPWVWTAEDVSFATEDSAKIKSKLCKSITAANSVASGYTGSKDGASASEDTGDSTGNTSTLLTQWLYPRSQVWPEASVRLSAAYLAAVRAALDPATEPDPARRSARVQAVMREHGEFYPRSVLLGGKMYAMQSASETASNSESKSADGDTTTTTTTSSSGSSSGQQYQSVGGNALLNGDPQGWIQSVGDVAYWRVIEYGQFLRMTDYLPPDITQAINALPPAPTASRSATTAPVAPS